jgi:hypothetical protein
VDRFLADPPLPARLDLELKNSRCYPSWISAASLVSV